MTLTLSPNKGPVVAARTHHSAQFGQLKSADAPEFAQHATAVCATTPAPSCPGRTERRSGSTLDTMPGTLRVASVRAATGTPITTSCAPFMRCSKIDAGRDQKPRQIGAGAPGRGAERHGIPLRQVHGGAEKIRRVRPAGARQV